jgi:large subunit ribosomal protein L4
LMEVAVRNLEGEQVGTVVLRDDVFGVAFNAPLVHQALVAQRANQRQGTADTKRRGEVAGGGRKPRPQKYTGRSRQGSIRAPQWRGGGVVFGPHPRDYRMDLPKRMRRQAIRCALSEKVRSGQLVVVDRFALAEPKTRLAAEALRKLGVERKALIAVDGDAKEAALRAVRNIPGTKTLPARLLNVRDLLEYDHLVLSLEAVKEVEETFNPERERQRKLRSRLASVTG